MLLATFNDLDPDEARRVVSVWAAIPSWVAEIVDGRPYPSVDRLAEVAMSRAAHWTPNDLETALASHPRIGERAEGSGAEAAASRREQASMNNADSHVADDLAAGNATYEARFGRVYLIRAAGRTPEEMLAELRRRLGNDDATEAQESLEQLAQIAGLRLRGVIEEAP